jgi:hypothetical protein
MINVRMSVGSQDRAIQTCTDPALDCQALIGVQQVYQGVDIR